MSWAGALALLRALLELLGLLAKRHEQAERERKQDERREIHKQIDDDLDAVLRDLDFMQPDQAKRPDGAPVDYSVSGPSGALRDENR